MSIVNDFDAIRAGLEKLEKKESLKEEPQPIQWKGGFWGVAGVVMRNKDTNEFVHCVPNTYYDLDIWEVHSIEGAF